MTNLDGATNEGDECAHAANAGELAARWNALTPEGREKAWQQMRHAADEATACYLRDHGGMIARLQDTVTELRRQQEVTHWQDAHTACTAMIADLRRQLADSTPKAAAYDAFVGDDRG